MSRLYAVESLFTLTGASADHRLRVAASLVGEIAAAIQARISGSALTIPAGVDAKWISECAKDLVAAGKNSLVIAGQRQPIEVHLLALTINSALGAFGNTVSLIPTALNANGSVYLAPPAENVGADIKNLDSDATDTLVILGGNPVYQFQLVADGKDGGSSGILRRRDFRKIKLAVFRRCIIWNLGATRQPATELLFRYSR